MKIDTSKISGYDDMSAEEKLAALEAYEIDDPDYTGYVKKDVFDKTASELAQKKKELNARLTDEEKAREESETKQKELEEKYEALLRESQVSKQKAKLIALGYDESLADDSAQALVEGDLDKVIENASKFKKSFEKQLRAEILKDTPKPTGSGGSDVMTLDKFRKMGAADRAKYAQAHPEDYKALYSGGSE